jgi:hypothetical protein
MIKKGVLLFLAFLGFIFSVVPPRDAFADVAFLQVTGNPYHPTGPFLTLTGMGGQSACVIGLNGALGGTWAVEGLYHNTQAWTPALTVVSPDGLNPSTAITSAGSYAFNCADMIAVRLDGTAGTGTPLTLLAAGGGISRVLFNTSGGGGGTITAVNGTSPIMVSTLGTVVTVSCPLCESTTRTQVAQVTTSAVTPFQATFTFGTPYASPPICVATCFSSAPLTTMATIVSESNSAVTIYDSSQTGAQYNVQCTHS